MDETMLGKVIKKLVALSDVVSGTVYDLLEKLSGKEGEKWHEVFKLLSRLSPEKAIEALSVAKTLLTDLFTLDVKKKGRFVAKNKFVEGKNGFWSFGLNFKKIISEWVEDEVEAVTLKVRELTESSKDDRILKASGGKEVIEITLGQLFQVLGDKRFKDGRVYFSYIKGTDFAVYFYWCGGDGWYFGAYPVVNPNPWHAGYCLIVRDSGS